MANIFKKLGLIEDAVPEELNLDVPGDAFSPEVATDSVTVENPVQSIYDENCITQDGNTIFTAEKFIRTLPADLPLAMKKTSVLSILSAAGLDLDAIMEDGRSRMETLSAAATQITEQTESDMMDEQSAIEADLVDIERRKNNIFQYKKELEKITSDISAETDRIKKLLEFLTEEK